MSERTPTETLVFLGQEGGAITPRRRLEQASVVAALFLGGVVGACGLGWDGYTMTSEKVTIGVNCTDGTVVTGVDVLKGGDRMPTGGEVLEGSFAVVPECAGGRGNAEIVAVKKSKEAIFGEEDQPYETGVTVTIEDKQGTKTDPGGEYAGFATEATYRVVNGDDRIEDNRTFVYICDGDKVLRVSFTMPGGIQRTIAVADESKQER